MDLSKFHRTNEIFYFTFKIGAHGAFKKLLDTQMIDEKVYSVKHFLILSRFIFMHSLPE